MTTDETGPSAADLMMQMVRQAEAAAPEPTPPPPTSSLAEREARVLAGLRGNRRLMAGLDEAGKAAVLAWSEGAARRIVADTDGLDDAAAEGILQPRIRALRKMIYDVKKAVATGAPATPDLVAALSIQAARAFGPGFVAPDPEATAAFCDRYNAAPAEFAARCAIVHDFTTAQPPAA